MSVTIESTARRLLDIVPPIMRTIRHKWKKGPIGGVTNSQFRMLMFIQKHPGAPLLDVAEHLGLTSPTTSTTIDELVCNQLVKRESSTEDRRKVALTLTDEGQNTLEEVFNHSRDQLASILSPLSQQELGTVFQALGLLEPLFTLHREQADILKPKEEKI
jgi:DNA-binding MarR family transcriptional regulator